MNNSKFVLHEHDADRRGKHWDLRFKHLEDKNWDSFACNQIPPTNSGNKIYIVKTTIHSEEQALFTGKIPSGEYGAGTLKVIDEGKYDIIKYSKSHIVIEFHGKHLKGRYHFISTAVFGKKGDWKKKVYMFFKSKDKE